MKLRRAAAAAACLTALAMPAAAGAADPLPPGAAKSDNLEYVDRSADAAGITEGKFDRIGKTDVLVVTGRFGFKTYDVTDPANPVLLDTFMPPGVNPANGYWQDEDMELDTGRNLIIGALDPRHNETDPVASPMKAKGVGDLGICGVGAAVAHAIYHATGVRVRDYPITLDKLLGKLPPSEA